MNSKQHTLAGLALMAVAVIFGVLGAPQAFAQAGAAPSLNEVIALRDTAVPNDISKYLWSSIFGNFFWNPFSIGTPSTLLGNALVVFNTAIFAIGIVWMSYGIVSGVVGTAQDGQALGQRINSAWYPIRVVTGVVGMTPILGGFTLSQGALMWIAGLAIGIANTIYISSLDRMETGLFHSGSVTASPKINSKDVVDKLIAYNTCLRGYEVHQEAMAAQGVAVSAEHVVRKVLPPAGDNGFVIQYGSRANPTLCGSIAVTRNPGAGRTNSSWTGFRIDSVDYGAVGNAVFNSQRGNLTSLDGAAYLAAREIIQSAYAKRGGSAPGGSGQGGGRSTSAILKDLKSQYEGSVKAATSQALANVNISGVTQQARANMLSYGWMSLGSWFSTFAEVNAGLTEAANNVDVTASNRADIRPDNSMVQEVMAVVDSEIADANATVGSIGGTNEGPLVGAIKESCGSPSSGGIGGAIDATMGTATGNCSLGQNIASMLISAASAGSGGGSGAVGGVSAGRVGQDRLVNPIIGLKNVGDYMMTISSTFIIGKWAAEHVPTTGPLGKLASVSGVSAIADKISGAGVDGGGGNAAGIGMLGVLFFAAAAYLAIYIPLLPFVIWTGALISYAASFIEGLLAMPLHSLSHLDTDGEGMGQRTGHGYLFLLNTLARPPLMVISFILASALVIGFGTIITMLYIPALANAQGNSVTGIFSIFGFVIVYGVIMTIIINGCFDLCQVIPDQVIGFVGAGSVSTTLGRDAEGKINNMFLGAARTGSHAFQGKGMKDLDPKARGGNVPKTTGS